MKGKIYSLCLVWTILMAVSCTSDKRQGAQVDDETAFDSVQLPAYSGYTAVAVTHSVKDFDSWLKAYTDASEPASRLSIYASPDDPNLITVFELTKSHEDAKNNFTSDKLKEVMRNAGVLGEPKYQYFDVRYRATNPTNKVYRLGVTHRVESYERWKKIFDEDEVIRAEAQLELRAISTNADDPLIINVMFATDDIEKAKNVINSGELKKRMKEAGVLTEPDLSVFRVPGN
jgi:hypothetical protein